MSEKRKYRTFTPEQKAEIVLAGLRGDRTVRDIYREYEIAETLYHQWRERLPEAGKAALATQRDKGGHHPDAEIQKTHNKVDQHERTLGGKPSERRNLGEA